MVAHRKIILNERMTPKKPMHKVAGNRFLIGIASVWLVLPGTPLAAEVEDPPNMELLEFLGEWKATDGQWMDPMILSEMQEPEMRFSNTADTDDVAEEQEND